ncbi:MAG: hypothetical protein H5T86_06900 [Armatimonadetes bacterium]|nr:hypothetical protein [Armatimonadota bacterium]
MGQQLGIVALVFEGDRVTAVEKRPVRYGQAPIAAVAYALAEWAVRENIASAALETLVSVDGPGAVLHMGEGVMERYLMGIHGAFEGEVLSYSRTADLDEAYFKTDVAPLAVLAAGYLAEMESLPLRDAFERAKQEVKSEPAD